MRIALIAGPWLPVPPPGYGGTEAVVDRLARGFAAEGHDVTLFTTGDSTCPVPRSWALAESQMDRIGDSILELPHVMAAYEAIASNFDIVHDHTVLGVVYGSGLHQHGLVTTNHGPFTGELNAIYRRVVPQSAALIAISHDQASRSAAPVASVIHHGLDLDEFPAGDGGGGYLMFLGRFHPDKGAVDAITAAEATGQELVLAAKVRDQQEHEHFRTEIQPRLGGSIHYVGEADQREKVRLLRSARALLNPIRWPEPFGLVMIEALACGTPVITYDIGAAPEIVEDGKTGFVCASLAQLIDAIAAIDQLDRGACRGSIEQHFSTERMVEEHLDLYERLLSHKHISNRKTVPPVPNRAGAERAFASRLPPST